MARTSWPALHLQLPHADRVRLGNLIWAAIDDLHPTAIDDSEADAIVAYFAGDDLRAQAAAHLRRELAPLGLTVREFDVPDEGWARRSQAAIAAVRVGRLTIAPPWDRPADASDAIIIVPSMGFGTGHHASTRLCLAALQRLDLAGCTVIDVGTGSGVLAIAAIRLGARSALAIDTDDDALASARENVEANGVADRVTCEHCDVREITAPPANVVMANLTGPLLIASAHDLARSTLPRGHLIFSGLLDSEEDAVVSAYAGLASLGERDREDGWMGLTLRVS